jgi:hypothetical protein
MLSHPNPEEYRIVEFVGLDALESIRPLWEQWQNHPNVDFDFFCTVVKSRSSVINPIAIVIYHNDTPISLCAGRLEKVTLPISFGYLKIARCSMVQLTIVYGGLMGSWEESEAVFFIHHIRQMMRPRHIDAVHIAAMRCENPVYKAANRIIPMCLRDKTIKNNLHWWADIVDTFDAFQKKINAKHRSRLRRKERFLVEQCGGAIHVRTFQTPDEVSLFCATAEDIAKTTYLRGLGEGFYHNQEMQNRLDLGARKGWMRGYVLYANGKPCSFWQGTLYKNIFYLDYTAYISEMQDYNVGELLFLKMINGLYDEGGIRGIDFGSGDAIYKQNYGDRNWKESDIYLFNNTPKMLLVNITRKSTALLRLAMEKTLLRFELLNRVKKCWRLLAQKSIGIPINTETIEKESKPKGDLP